MILEDIDKIEFAQLVKKVESLDGQETGYPTLRLAFLRNISIDLLVPYMKYLCYQEKCRAIVYMGGYDTVMQEAIDPKSPLYRHEPDIISVCLRMEILSPRLSYEFSGMGLSEVEEERDKVLDFVGGLLHSIRKNSNAVILLHNFELPAYPSFGIYDGQKKDNQINTLRRINLDLIDIARGHEGVYIVDIESLKSGAGYNNFFDNRYWYLARAPYRRGALKLIAKEYLKFIRAFKGRNKKCLVLDCDNTLWGGILDEDGMDKIQIGNTYPGCAYKEFQQAVINLYNRGVILALCSKNNEKEVFEVLEKHPDMILRKKHFCTTKINWDDKVKNLKAIARDLNVGLDSMVFVDDNDFEINLVKQLAPEVTAIRLPQDDPTLYASLLNSCGLFDALSVSEEDRVRSKMYRQDLERKRAMTDFSPTDMDDYYRYLQMEVEIREADDFSTPRISQLTQRTNQFNLTSKRYQESDIKRLAESRDSSVYYLKLRDRFGESGIVGAAILIHKDKKCTIDTFLLSCRIIGRTIESVFLKFCTDVAQEKGCEKIIGIYAPTPKNGLVRDFYLTHKFVNDMQSKGQKNYVFYTRKEKLEYPRYFTSIAIPGIKEGYYK